VGGQPLPQGPGPPQRPHIGIAGVVDFADASDATAKALNLRPTFVDPHCGHFALSRSLADRTSVSNDILHDRHSYSYIGIG
jgi:hypothetical protein